jgi:hypothetical protein
VQPSPTHRIACRADVRDLGDERFELLGKDERGGGERTGWIAIHLQGGWVMPEVAHYLQGRVSRSRTVTAEPHHQVASWKKLEEKKCSRHAADIQTILLACILMHG